MSSDKIHPKTGKTAFYPWLVIVGIAAFLGSCVTPSIRVTEEQNSGDRTFNEHRYPEAIGHYTKMLEASAMLGIYRNKAMEGEVCRKIANGYEMLGKYNDALAYVRKALVLDSTSKNIPGMTEDYRHVGSVHVYMGCYHDAISSLKKSLELGKGMESSLKSPQRLLIAEASLSLGQLYSVLGKSQPAFDYTLKAIGIFRDCNDERGVSEASLTLASLDADQGNYRDARKLVDESLTMATALGLGTARQHQLMASVESSEGDYQDALKHQEKALEEADKAGIAGQITWATIGLGDIYSQVGDMKRASRYYMQANGNGDTGSLESESIRASIGMRMGDLAAAGRYFSSQGSSSGRAISSLRIAEMMTTQSKTDSALIMLDQAYSGFRASRNIQGMTNVRVLKGRILVDKGNLRQAGLVLDSALSAGDLPDSKWQAYFQKGRLSEKMNDDDKAIEYYFRAVEIIERMRGSLASEEFRSSFINNKRDVYDKLILLLFRKNRISEAFRVSEQDRARSFYDILAGKKIGFRGSVEGNIAMREQDMRMEIQKLYRLIRKSEEEDSSSAPAFRSEISHLRQELADNQVEYDKILDKIRHGEPSYNEMISADPVNAADLQKVLDNKSAALVYWISDEKIILWIITPGDIYCTSVTIDYGSLSELIGKTRSAIEGNDIVKSAAGLKSLYNILIHPAEDRIKQFTSLVIIPNGPLHFLPFQALISGTGEYLVQRYNIIYSPSAGVQILCSGHQSAHGSKFFGTALADISVGGKPGLPGTEMELNKILPLFQARLSAFGKDATETFVKKNAGNFDFIHFATHGSCNFSQPLYSCLYFPQGPDDDGKLNVYEVLEMNLNAKMVTLSACETGLGNLSQGDELVGLSRAFLFAGSSSVVVSLWAVADYPTSLLMSSFYRNLKDHPAQEALTMAQREIMKLFPQPLYWSPFILIGNGSVTAD